MTKYNPTNLELLQELKQKLKTNQIGFWIEKQDCYLWENTFHYSNKIKVGDLSMTREKWWVKWIVEFNQYYQESEIKRQLLAKQFQDISDVALIEELAKRVKKQAIKLSMYSNQDHIFLKAQDIECGTSLPLPIVIEETE